METTLYDEETFNKNDTNTQNTIKVDSKDNKKKSCHWNEETIKLLLSFLIERKEEVNQLSTKRGGSGNTKAKLWQDASNIFLDSNYQYSAEQCAVKWKNIKKKYKDDMDHNKRSGNNPIEVKYKAEVEEILDGNRPSLTPKLLDSSLDHNGEVNMEKEVPFNEITGRTKRKNRSDESIQEDEPRKANRSEVRKVKNMLEDLIYQKKEEQEYKRREKEKREIERKEREEQRKQEFNLLISALNSSTNMILSQNNVPFYYPQITNTSPINSINCNTRFTNTPGINHNPQITNIPINHSTRHSTRNINTPAINHNARNINTPAINYHDTRNLDFDITNPISHNRYPAVNNDVRRNINTPAVDNDVRRNINTTAVNNDVTRNINTPAVNNDMGINTMKLND